MQIIIMLTRNKKLARRVWEICEKIEDCLLMWYNRIEEIANYPEAELILLDVDTIRETQNPRYASKKVVCLKSSLEDTKRTAAIYKKGAIAVKQSKYDHIIKSTITFYLDRYREKELALCHN